MAGIEEGLLYKDLSEEGIPEKCVHCGGPVKYAGLGEYECEDCGKISFSNYGKVRSYLESHSGAMVNEVMAATGVSKSFIKKLLADDRIQRKPNSKGYNVEDE